MTSTKTGISSYPRYISRTSRRASSRFCPKIFHNKDFRFFRARVIQVAIDRYDIGIRVHAEAGTLILSKREIQGRLAPSNGGPFLFLVRSPKRQCEPSLSN